MLPIEFMSDRVVNSDSDSDDNSDVIYDIGSVGGVEAFVRSMDVRGSVRPKYQKMRKEIAVAEDVESLYINKCTLVHCIPHSMIMYNDDLLYSVGPELFDASGLLPSIPDLCVLVDTSTANAPKSFSSAVYRFRKWLISRSDTVMFSLYLAERGIWYLRCKTVIADDDETVVSSVWFMRFDSLVFQLRRYRNAKMPDAYVWHARGLVDGYNREQLTLPDAVFQDEINHHLMTWTIFPGTKKIGFIMNADKKNKTYPPLPSKPGLFIVD